MGTLFRAIAGVSLALLLAGQFPAMGWEPALAKAGADIASTRPKERLLDAAQEQFRRLRNQFPPQNGTEASPKAADFQAHALQTGR